MDIADLVRPSAPSGSSCRELSTSSTPLPVRQWMSASPSWLVIHPMQRINLPFPDLGMGEREAIALAREEQAGVLLTDDLQARVSALSLGLRVIPTLRILKLAAEIQLLKFDDVVRRLQQTNFRISQQLIDQISNE